MFNWNGVEFYQELRDAIYDILDRMKIALHYETIGNLFRQYPEGIGYFKQKSARSKVTNKMILGILSRNKNLFIRVAAGTYKRKK